MNRLAGVIMLVGFYALGEAVVRLASLPVPGAVVGALLLLVALVALGDRLAGRLDQGALWLISHMALFILPSATGLWFLEAAVRRQMLPILMAIVVSTLLAMLVTGLGLQWLIRRWPERPVP